MKRKITSIASAATAIMFLLGAGAAFAQTQTAAEKAMATAKSRGNQEITRRVTSLSNLSERIGEMKNISATDKTNLQGQLQSQATALTQLNAQIQADTSTTTLKTDVQSITDSYRIFALVLPQGRIYAAVDRITTIVADMVIVGSKLQARITLAQTAGADVTAATTAITDYNTKVSDAQTQAVAALNEIATLVPDQGDAAKMQANTTTLKDARAKLKISMDDLVAARKDINTIRKALPKQASTTASTTPSSQ